jgi:serine/threonine protein phosphatase PrpC
MEDAMSNVQDLRIDALNNTPLLSPQSFFGVFDGHVGGLASIYLEEHLHANICRDISSIAPSLLESIKEIGASNSDAEWRSIDEIVNKTLVATYLATDNDFISTSEKPEHGSTATTAFMLGNRLYVANVGDSRVFLCRKMKAYPMTEDHKPNRPDELKRIQAAGGYVINKRVMGELSVSRTFGDSGFKTGMQVIVGDDVDGDPDDPNRLVKLRSNSPVDKGAWDTPLIVAEPEIKVTSITSQDQFLLLACDGLFDVFNYDEITAFILEQMSSHQNARICCENLTYEAISVRKSKDNVSVLLIILNKWY